MISVHDVQRESDDGRAHFSEKIIMNSAGDSDDGLVPELSYFTHNLRAPRPAAVLDTHVILALAANTWERIVKAVGWDSPVFHCAACLQDGGGGRLSAGPSAGPRRSSRCSLPLWPVGEEQHVTHHPRGAEKRTDAINSR